MSSRYFLIGTSVTRSPTPRMMQAAFDAAGMDCTYEALNVGPEEFGRTMQKLKESRAEGFNVTMPYKASVLPFVGRTDDTSSRIRAVNTVRRDGDIYEGHNTDVSGIIQPLRSRGIRKVATSAVVGTGGASRAFVSAMNEFGCEELTVMSRNPKAASRYFKEMREGFTSMKIKEASSHQLDAAGVDVLFNGSPAGTNGTGFTSDPLKLATSATTVFDAVYTPVETGLIRKAKRRGCRVVYGHEMLLSQGAEAFRIWRGTAPPASVMRDSLLASLEVHA